jgi:uncharacterized protein (TIGR02246 family)
MRFLNLLGFLAIGASMLAPASAADATDEGAIRELVAKYAAARESSDADAIEALFTNDADQLVSSGTWRKGRDELVRGMLESSQSNPGDRTLAVESVRFVTPDVAIADARYEIAGTADREARKMWSTFVAHRTPDSWRIAAIRNMLPAR